MPKEDGVDQFRDTEDEETPISIVTSEICDVTFMEYNISTLRCNGIVVDDDNDPEPENVFNHEKFLPFPETLSFGFQVTGPWRQSRTSGSITCHSLNFFTSCNSVIISRYFSYLRPSNVSSTKWFSVSNS